MRILAIGDLHGKVPTRLKQFIRKNKIDLILCTGDVYGDHTRKWLFKYAKQLKRDEYGCIGPGSLIPIMGKAKVMRLSKTEIAEGVAALKGLERLDVPVFIVHGNADQSFAAPWSSRPKLMPIELVIKNFRNVRQLDYSKTRFDDYMIAGMGCKFTAKMPGRALVPIVMAERKKERAELKRLLTEPRRTILLTHEPPQGTLDIIKERTSHRYRKHVGDDILAAAIKKYQPLLGICGHIHECRGKTKIGRTLIVNTGYGHDGEAAIVEIPSLKVRFVRI